jgi:hypothetical protein
MNDEAVLFTMTQLKDRAWTQALVKKFLDPPDATCPNPHYKSAAPMWLYRASRVEVAESCEDWRRAAERSRVRAIAGKEVAAQKAAELVKQAEHLPITGTRLPLDQLQKRAIASSNAFHEALLWERGHAYEQADAQSDPAFLSRITVNDIRHHLTAYDRHLEEVAGRIGVRQAIATIRLGSTQKSARPTPHMPRNASGKSGSVSWRSRHEAGGAAHHQTERSALQAH